MSETVFRSEATQDPGEYLSQELLAFEMTLHPNLKDHHNTERVAFEYVAEGVYQFAELSRVAALGADGSTSYCPMLTLKDGLQDRVYTWVEGDRVLFGTPERPDVEVDNPQRAIEMANGINWLHHGVVNFPDRATYAIEPSSSVWQ